MYFHNIVYIQYPYCRFSTEVDSNCTSCYICNGSISSLETNDYLGKNPKQ